MAFSFNGTNQYIGGSPTAVRDAPMSMFVRSLASHTNLTVIPMGMIGGGEQQYIQHTSTGSAQYFLNTPPTQFDYPQVSAARTANTWWSLMGVSVSTTSRRVYYYETNVNTNSVGTTVTAFSKTLDLSIGSLSNFFISSCTCAEAAIWDAELTQDEFTSLAKGFKPSRVRPQSLKFYAPLVRNVQDVARGLSLTNNNTATVADHPRVY